MTTSVSVNVRGWAAEKKALNQTKREGNKNMTMNQTKKRLHQSQQKPRSTSRYALRYDEIELSCKTACECHCSQTTRDRKTPL